MNTNLLEAKDWFLFGAMLVVWVFTAGVLWSKLNTKIDSNSKELEKKASIEQLNGMGLRVEGIKTDCSEHQGRMERFEKELAEYRQEARTASDRMAVVGKGVEDLKETLQQGVLDLGSRLAEVNKSLVAMDKANSNRLTRLETVSMIEKKIGPLPTE
jgi:chromosome segregation ATPase